MRIHIANADHFIAHRAAGNKTVYTLVLEMLLEIRRCNPLLAFQRALYWASGTLFELVPVYFLSLHNKIAVPFTFYGTARAKVCLVIVALLSNHIVRVTPESASNDSLGAFFAFVVQVTLVLHGLAAHVTGDDPPRTVVRKMVRHLFGLNFCAARHARYNPLQTRVKHVLLNIMRFYAVLAF